MLFRSALMPDAGGMTPTVDGGGMMPASDGGEEIPETDGGTTPSADAGESAGGAGDSDDGGCSAAVGDVPAVMALVLMALLGLRRRRI